MSVTPSAHSARRAARGAASPAPLSLSAAGASNVTSDSDALSQVARRLAEIGRDAAAAREVLATGAVALLAAEGALVAGIDELDFRVMAAVGSLAPLAGFHALLAGSLAEEAMSHGEPIALNEAAGDARVEPHFLAAFAPREVAVAPMMIGQAPFGFLLALNSTRGAFSATDVAHLQRLADYGAISIRQADLHARAEEAAHDAHALSEAVRQLNQSLDLDRVVLLLASHAAQMAGARGARVTLVEDTRLCRRRSIRRRDRCGRRVGRDGAAVRGSGGATPASGPHD